MSNTNPWGHKLDAYSRLRLEDGLPAAGIDVTVRLTGKDASAVREVEGAGLKLHAHVGEILVGHVANAIDLRNIAQLACVQEVQLARPLYEDGSDLTGREG